MELFIVVRERSAEIGAYLVVADCVREALYREENDFF